jgi:hypothetical protein
MKHLYEERLRQYGMQTESLKRPVLNLNRMRSRGRPIPGSNINSKGD